MNRSSRPNATANTPPACLGKIRRRSRPPRAAPQTTTRPSAPAVTSLSQQGAKGDTTEGLIGPSSARRPEPAAAHPRGRSETLRPRRESSHPGRASPALQDVAPSGTAQCAKMSAPRPVGTVLVLTIASCFPAACGASSLSCKKLKTNEPFLGGKPGPRSGSHCRHPRA